MPDGYAWVVVLHLYCLPVFWLATVFLSIRIIRKDRLVVFILLFLCLVPRSADWLHGAVSGPRYPETTSPLITIRPSGRAIANEPIWVDVTFTNRSKVDYYVARGDGDLGMVPLGHWGQMINASYKSAPWNERPQILTKNDFKKVGAGRSLAFKYELSFQDPPKPGKYWLSSYLCAWDTYRFNGLRASVDDLKESSFKSNDVLIELK